MRRLQRASQIAVASVARVDSENATTWHRSSPPLGTVINFTVIGGEVSGNGESRYRARERPPRIYNYGINSKLGAFKIIRLLRVFKKFSDLSVLYTRFLFDNMTVASYQLSNSFLFSRLRHAYIFSLIKCIK